MVVWSAAEVCVGEGKCSREVSVVRCESTRGNMAVELVGLAPGAAAVCGRRGPCFSFARRALSPFAMTEDLVALRESGTAPLAQLVPVRVADGSGSCLCF